MSRWCYECDRDKNCVKQRLEHTVSCGDGRKKTKTQKIDELDERVNCVIDDLKDIRDHYVKYDVPEKAIYLNRSIAKMEER